MAVGKLFAAYSGGVALDDAEVAVGGLGYGADGRDAAVLLSCADGCIPRFPQPEPGSGCGDTYSGRKRAVVHIRCICVAHRYLPLACGTKQQREEKQSLLHGDRLDGCLRRGGGCL